MLAQINSYLQAVQRWMSSVASANAALAARVSTLEKEFAKMSTAQDDLTAAVATLTTAVSAAANEISALVAQVLAAVHAPAGVDPAAAESAARIRSGLPIW